MQSAQAYIPASTQIRKRHALVASADRSFRQRLSGILSGLRWQVHEAESGAEAWSEAEAGAPEAVVVDAWLPDLEVAEFLKDFRRCFPEVDLVTAGGSSAQDGPRGPYRQELLYALRRSQDTDTASWNAAPMLEDAPAETASTANERQGAFPLPGSAASLTGASVLGATATKPDESREAVLSGEVRRPAHAAVEKLPELIGDSPSMLEVCRRIRLVAPRTTPVLIEGPTGSGKELVAEALHRLSSRNKKPFVVINCAAIPEALLEAELFGHTRGAFTGAVQGRVGRIESADGGTLFLDEIGELPLALQSKLLRFVECGELQRVGDNEHVRVDVRIITATHRSLGQLAQSGNFRSDLYYRLAVFLIRTPALADHREDLPLLVNHFMTRMALDEPAKRLHPTALAKLMQHDWPGNVRELEHVLERGSILAGSEPVLTGAEIDFGTVVA